MVGENFEIICLKSGADPGFFEGGDLGTAEAHLRAQWNWGRGPGAEPWNFFFKVALRRRNLRTPQSPFLALKHFARVFYQFSDRNNCAPVVFELP